MRNSLCFHSVWKLGEKSKTLVRFTFFLWVILMPELLFAQTLRLTIDVKKASLYQVFQLISRQTNLSVVYNVDDINPNREVTCHIRNETITRALDMLFEGTGIIYTIIDKHIVLSIRHAGGERQSRKAPAGTRTVRGQVTDEENFPLIGVNILIKETGEGVISDEAGNYTLNIPDGTKAIVFSYIGYLPQEIAVDGKQTINVVLKENPNLLDEVVVTALSIEKKSKSLIYALQELPGSELTRAKEVSFINSLEGKTAGLVITPNSNGAGASTKLLLRGNKSIQGNNNPLIVIDGIPMANNSYGDGIEVVYGRGNDGGDALSTINPDDIAGISVLKGASASALYGAIAANGVIMVTTKKGNVGGIQVHVSSNMTMETAYSLPKLQQTYGAKQLNKETLQAQSWGSRMTEKATDNIGSFFRNGYTLHNSLSIDGGTEHSQSYFSYGNVLSEGVIPTNSFTRHNIAIRQSYQGFDNRLSLNLSGTYSYQSTVNKHYGGMLGNPLTGLYLFPRNGNFAAYRHEYERLDPQKEIYIQNWNQLEEHNQNPYWLLHRNRREEDRHRITFNSTVKYEFIPALNIQGRIGYESDRIGYRIERYATSWKDEMGGYKDTDDSYKHLYGDILLNFESHLSDFSFSLIAGSSFSDVQQGENGIITDGGNTKFEWIEIEDAKTGKIYKVPNNGNAFFVNNFTQNNYYRPEIVEKHSHTRLNSLFGMLQIGYKELAYLNITARNDWSSTLAFTNNRHMGYFYPSVGANILLTEVFPAMKQTIDFLKLRASYSVVGNGLPAYVTSQRPVIKDTSISYPASAPFSDLKPEHTLSIEGGFEVALLNNRLHIDFSYYKTNTLNQYFTIEAPWGSGYRYRNVNAGNVQNMGVEVSAGYFHSFPRDWEWQTGINFSYNKNRIIELSKESDSFLLRDGGGILSILNKGGSYGDIYTRKLLRDNDGAIILDKNGSPVKSDQPDVYIGNANPDINAGWNNLVTYKNFSLYVLIDGQIGGKVISATEAMLDGYGVSERTGKAREQGGIARGDGTFIDAEKYYHIVGATAYNVGYAGTEYVYDATSFRLREVSLGYQFRNLFAPGKHLAVSVVARNLCFLFKSSPCDPSVSGSTGNGWQGLDVFNLPVQRSIGLNIKLTL